MNERRTSNDSSEALKLITEFIDDLGRYSIASVKKAIDEYDTNKFIHWLDNMDELARMR